MATQFEPPWDFRPKGKHYYKLSHTLFEIDTKYIPIKVLGSGTYGTVCSALNTETNERVAVKKITNAFATATDSVGTLRELILSRFVHHENVISLKDVMMPSDWKSFKDVYLVYELMETDLQHVITSPLPLSKEHCKVIMLGLLRGLEYLHSANILHRDLKPANILINANCDVKICDFGLARTAGEIMTEYVVTRWYRAPELLLFCKYGAAVDVWSAGCIFAEILGRQTIFPGEDRLGQLKLIIGVLGSQTELDLEFVPDPRAKRFILEIDVPNGSRISSLFPHADPLAIDLLEKMLVLNPSKRITVSEALRHPYMSDLYDPMGNPPADRHISIDVDEEIGETAIRGMMLKEILQYHPEAAYANVLD